MQRTTLIRLNSSLFSTTAVSFGLETGCKERLLSLLLTINHELILTISYIYVYVQSFVLEQISHWLDKDGVLRTTY